MHANRLGPTVNGSYGFSKMQLRGIVLIVFFASFVLEVIGVYVPSRYYIFSATGYTILAIVIAVLIVLAARAMKQVVDTLKMRQQLQLVTSDPTRNMNNSSDTAGSASKVNRRELVSLVRKFVVFLFASSVGCAYLTLVAIVYFAGQMNEPWKMPFEPTSIILSVVGRFVVCIIILTCIFVFTIPKTMLANPTTGSANTSKRKEQQDKLENNVPIQGQQMKTHEQDNKNLRLQDPRSQAKVEDEGVNKVDDANKSENMNGVTAEDTNPTNNNSFNVTANEEQT
jgi:protein-S-isoprenylcysteine O-methyltransferase Ste14